MKEEYTKPIIKEEGLMNFQFASLEQISRVFRKEWEEHGTINGVKPLEKTNLIACRQCSACHGCR